MRYQFSIALGNPNSPRFAEIVKLTGVPLEQVALAMAGEFRRVDASEALIRLDLIASELGDLAGLSATTRAQSLVEFLDCRVGFTARPDRDPDALMLDRVIEERAGHPLALAIIHAAVARRCGVQLFPVGCGSKLVLADRGEERTVIIDPVPGGRRLEGELGWVCPHVVAKMLLDATAIRHRERGDIARAIRAAELRLQLPLDPRARERHELELRRLRATLN